MKKIHLILLVSFLSFAPETSKAQEVFNYVMENATRVIDNPFSNYTQTGIAQFKRTALTYLRSKAFETMPEVTTQFLDTQAYYLSEFISLFMEEIIKDKSKSEKVRKDKILLFMQASLSNPLFGDKDEDTTQSYIKEGTELTPFSLDTDWQKAFLAASSQL